MMLPLLAGGPGEWFEDHGIAVFGAIAIALAAIVAVRYIVPHAIRPAVERQMLDRPEIEVRRRTETLSNVIVRTAQVAFIIMALFTILPEFGFDIRALLAGVGITGIAIGLGAQSLVRDTLNGIFILSENQYARGDVVTVAGVTGTVEDVSLRRTILRSLDGVVYTVPNSSVIVAANHTRDFSHVRIAIPVAATSDLTEVRRVIDETGQALADDPAYRDIVTTPPRYVGVDHADMNGIAIQVDGVIAPGRQWEVAPVLRARLFEAFRREGIKTPWG